MSKLQELDNKYVANTYARFPVEIVSGKGSIAKDTDGKEYIDMGSGIGVTSFGIADDIWKQAVIDQLGKVQHMSNLYYTEPCVKLAELLCEKTGMKKVFFSNSGGEANECAIKVARKYAAEKKGPEYYTILTLWNSFHGRTLTTLAATGQDHYHELFQPLTPGFVHATANDLVSVQKLVEAHKVAGILIECIHEKDIVFMVDEVQTGNGRTGKLYSYMNFGVNPDVVTTAKGIGGGLPLGACLMGEKVEHVLGHGDHGSTFGGNPVACAGAVSIINRLDDAFLAEVQRKGKILFSALEGAPGIEMVTGLGMMCGVKPVKPAADVVKKCIEKGVLCLTKPAADVVKKCIEKGVLCLTAKDKVRLLPALNMPEEVLVKAVNIIKEACAE